MGCFQLDPEPRPQETAPLHGTTGGLNGTILLLNARWFTHIRWIVVGLLLALGTLRFLPDPTLPERYGLPAPGLWPLILAGILTLLNLGSIRWIHHLSPRSPSSRSVAANLWFQVVTDLLVLSVVVYQIGPTTTVIGFSYLFHITLACIFFGRRDSFLVTVLSAILFLGAVALEILALPFPDGIGSKAAMAILAKAAFAVPAVFIWVIVWYLVSFISEAVRRIDRNLEEANKRILQADQEMNLQMLRVTHDLKAPFSGIENNIQLLKHLHWNDTPECVREIIGKIDKRSMSLRARIGDILTLGSLRSEPADAVPPEPVKLGELLESILQELQGMAEEKQVTLELPACEAVVSSNRKQLKILFLNLVSNAIAYSNNGGRVDIGIDKDAARTLVRVADHGIGISDQALPRIFDDFYRTPEAAAFNPNSTGLGLAIVRQIALNLSLAISVESERNMGTTFHVLIPTE